MQNDIEVEISINIGNKNLKVEIRKGQSIENFVKNFISEYKISPHYQDILLNTIKQKIKLKKEQNESINQLIQNKFQIQEPSKKKLSQKQQLNCTKNESIIKKQNKVLAEMLKIKQEVNMKRQAELQQIRMSSRILKKQINTQKQDQEVQKNQNKNLKICYTQSNECSQRSINFEKMAENGKFNTIQNKQNTNRQYNSQLIHPLQNNKNKLNTNKNQGKSTSNLKNVRNTQNQSLKTQEANVSKKSKLLQKINIEKQKMSSINNLTDFTSQSNNQVNKSIELIKKQQMNSSFNTKNSKQNLIKKQNQKNGIEQVYSKWKVMEQNRKINKKQQQTKKSNLKQKKEKNPNEQKHENDFFYTKGMTFLQQKNKNIEQKFKQIYPFKPNKTSKQVDSQKVTYRLYNEAREKSMRKLKQNLDNKQKPQVLELKLNYDPIRQKVRKRDEQYDVIISDLIQQGHLKNRISIQKNRSISPFRKTAI